MNFPTWLREIQRQWLVRRPSGGARRRVPLIVESPEDRVTPVAVGATTADLINAIKAADNPAQGPVVLDLPANTT
jgi:hypothetical protein